MPFCENCGVKIADDALFCENCGTANRDAKTSGISENRQSQEEPQKHHVRLNGKMKCMIIAVEIFVVCIASFLGSDSRKYINIVKQGSIEYYDQITTGEVFRLFFEDAKWKYNSKTKLVEVRGECLYGDVPVEATIEYYVYDNGTFNIKAILLDDGYSVDTLSERNMISFLSDVYESAYRDKGLEPPANIGDTLDSLDFLTDFFSY